MSWYEFSGPVQGGGFGPVDDEESRRRRRHNRDAGAPYTGGASSAGAMPSLEWAEADDYEAPAEAQMPSRLQAGGGPLQFVPRSLERRASARAAAAVDTGSGPQQGPAMTGAEYGTFLRHAGVGPGEESSVAEADRRFREKQQATYASLQDQPRRERSPGRRATGRERERGEAAAYEEMQREEEKASEPISADPKALMQGVLRRTQQHRDRGLAGTLANRPAHEEPLIGPREAALIRPGYRVPGPIRQARRIQDKARAIAAGGPPGRPPPFEKIEKIEKPKKPGDEDDLFFVRRTPAHAAAQINAELRRKKDEIARKANEAKQFAQAQQASFGTAPEEALPYRSRQLLRQEREKALRQLQEQNKFLIGRSGYLGAAALQLEAERGRAQQETRHTAQQRDFAQRAAIHERLHKEDVVDQLNYSDWSLDQVRKEAKELQERLRVTRQHAEAARGEQADHLNRYAAELLRQQRALRDAEAKLKAAQTPKPLFRREKAFAAPAFKQPVLQARQEAKSKPVPARQRLTAVSGPSLSRPVPPKPPAPPAAPPAAPPRPAPRRERAPAAPRGGGPIIVQGAGGGGSSSSGGAAGGAAASGGAGPAARAPDLSKVVEAVKQIAATAAAGKKKAGGSTKGITQARRSYTDKRKTKIAELRALKSKRIREFNTKTKKLPKAERQKQRREYKKKVESQLREMQTRFPTARGLKSVGAIRELIRKLNALKTAK